LAKWLIGESIRYIKTAPIAASTLQGPYVVGGNGAMKPFQGQLAGRFDVGQRFDGGLNLAVDQNLVGARFAT
jgi:hypothetical protein